jgi:hypothetical protein
MEQQENLNNTLKQRILARKQQQNNAVEATTQDKVSVLELLQTQVNILLNRVSELEEASNSTIEAMRSKLSEIDNIVIENTLDIETLKEKTIVKSSIDLKKTESKLNKRLL